MSEAVVETTEEKAPTQAEKDLARAIEIITPRATDGTTDDELKILLMKDGGFPFAKAGRLFNRAMESMGARLSAKDRFELVSETLLENDFAPVDWSEVQTVVEYLASEIDSTDEKQALVAVRRFAKENGIDLPKKPKASAGPGKGRGFRGQILDWFVANVEKSDDDFVAWMKTNEKPEALIKRFLGFRENARLVHAAMTEKGL